MTKKRNTEFDGKTEFERFMEDMSIRTAVRTNVLFTRGFAKKKKPSVETISNEVAVVDMKEGEKKMMGFLDVFKSELAKIRTGRPDPAMIDHLKVEAYGDHVGISTVAQISVKSSKMLVISPYDNKLAGDILKSVQTAGLNLNPSMLNDSIQVPIPMVTKESRELGVKHARDLKERTKISIKGVRKDFTQKLNTMKKEKTASEDEVFRYFKQLDDITEKTNSLVDETCDLREKEITAS